MVRRKVRAMPKSLKSRTRKLPPYKGDLSEPIYLLAPAEAARGEATYRRIDKLEKLFDHHKIDPRDNHKWFRLSLALAVEHVPGFHVVYGDRPKRGRHRTWKAGLEDDLVQDIEPWIGKGKLTIEQAIFHLRTTSKKWQRFTQQNLVTRYREARRERRKRHRLASKFMKLGVGLSGIPRSESGLTAGIGRLAGPDEK
jgi:hypothetical protein